MSEKESGEIAKLALACLKTRLETDRLKAESDVSMWSFLSSLMEKIPEILAVVISLTEEKRLRPLPPAKKPPFMLAKEDLMFFAKKAPLQDLEAVVRDLTAVLEARKKAESK